MTPKELQLEEKNKIVGVEETFTARIYVGCYDTEKDITRPVAEVKETCQFYVQDTGLCVNVQNTWYSYGDGEGTGGNEPGAIVELIHYPRFPDEDPEYTVTNQALELAEILMDRMHQKRVSVVAPEKTYTLQNPDHEDVR